MSLDVIADVDAAGSVAQAPTYYVKCSAMPDRETGDYSAVCPELPGCASAGETVEEATSNIREAIELYLMPGEIDLPPDAKLFEGSVG